MEVVEREAESGFERGAGRGPGHGLVVLDGPGCVVVDAAREVEVTTGIVVVVGVAEWVRGRMRKMRSAVAATTPIPTAAATRRSRRSVGDMGRSLRRSFTSSAPFR